jgi:hypothetical protein
MRADTDPVYMRVAFCTAPPSELRLVSTTRGYVGDPALVCLSVPFW